MNDYLFDSDLGRVRQTLLSYAAQDVQQEEVRERMLAFLAKHPENACHRECLEGHFTGSVMLLDAKGETLLLTLHRKLGRWLQLGGHCDGDANMVGVALREAQEESGIEQIQIDSRPVDLDIHVIPERKGVPEHLHLDVRFVAWAEEGAKEVISDESVELRWVPLGEVAQLSSDESMIRTVERLEGWVRE
jgi:8-oxo-dGTP pyrophosphatase MutT (NUDIX family)